MEQSIESLRPSEQQEQSLQMPVAQSFGTMLTDPKTLNTLNKLANMFAGSQIVPEMYQQNPANCFVACEMANRMGVSPMIVMQNLYVVKGKPAWSGQACIALINGTHLFSPLRFVFVGERDTDSYGCYVTCERRSDGEKLEGSVITIGMANAEGWIQKNGSKWKTMPEQMLQYRAASFFARVHCPHALMGLQTVEEVNDAFGSDEQKKEVLTMRLEDYVNESRA